MIRSTLQVQQLMNTSPDLTLTFPCLINMVFLMCTLTMRLDRGFLRFHLDVRALFKFYVLSCGNVQLHDFLQRQTFARDRPCTLHQRFVFLHHCFSNWACHAEVVGVVAEWQMILIGSVCAFRWCLGRTAVSNTVARALQHFSTHLDPKHATRCSWEASQIRLRWPPCT